MIDQAEIDIIRRKHAEGFPAPSYVYDDAHRVGPSARWLDEIDRLKAEIERKDDKIEGFEADLDSAVEVAFNRGAAEWVRLNYPRQYERLSAAALSPVEKEKGR